MLNSVVSVISSSASISKLQAAMSQHEDDWQSEMMDADGNYYQDGRLPEDVSRGSAPQRLNMAHGFMKHIALNQNARMQYESQNPSSGIQQRYLAEPQSPDTWRKDEALLSRGDDVEEHQDKPRYLPPHVRQHQQLGAPAANCVAQPDMASPAPPESQHAVTASSLDSASETAESRKEKRRHRQGHAAYTAPPLLTKRSASQPAGSDSPAAPSSSSQPAQRPHGNVRVSGNPFLGDPSAGNVTQQLLVPSDHPPGFPSNLTTPQASAAQSSLSMGRSGDARATFAGSLTQPVRDLLAPSKQGTWPSEDEEEEENPLQTLNHDLPPGYGPPGSGPLRRQTPAASSPRAEGNGPAQAGANRPPGFAGTPVPAQSNLLRSVATDAMPSSGGLPPGFASASKPLTPSKQGLHSSNADRPPGFSHPGTAPRHTPVSASTDHTPHPAEPPVAGKGSANTGPKGRAQPNAAASPVTIARSSQPPAAASAVGADVPPGFPVSSSPSLHPAEPRPTGNPPTRPHSRAPSGRLQTATAGSPLAGTAEKPPGFGAAGVGVPQTRTPASQQQVTGAPQSQRSVQALPKPQQQLTAQGARQKGVSQGNVQSTSAAVSVDLPPGFPATLQSPAVQSASSQQPSDGNLPSASAAVGDDLPPGFPAQSLLSSLNVQSASGLPTHAPKTISLTKLSSAPMVGESSLRQQPSSSWAADDLLPGFPSATPAAASVSHVSSDPPASAAADLPPGFPTLLPRAAASVNQAGSSKARRSSPAPYQAAASRSGWDTDETEAPATTFQPHTHIRQPPHASAADAEPPPGFSSATQQPASATSRPPSASQRPSTRPQAQLPVVPPALERKVSVIKLPTTPLSGVRSAFSANTSAQIQRSVTMTRPPVTPSSDPHSTPPTAPQSSNKSKRRTQGQALPQSPDLPPGFSTMQRSSSTPSAPAVATAAQTSGSTGSAGQGTSSPAAADLPPGFARLGAAPQNPADLPPGFPGNSASAPIAKVLGVPKGSSRKEAGRKTQVPQAGTLQSDARRKAQLPKAASDNLGELPPGFAVSQGQLQPEVRQGPNQDAPDFLPGYHARHPAQGLSAGSQQDAAEHTPARSPSSSTAAPDRPPGFGARTTQNTARAQSAHLMPRSSPSPSVVTQPSVHTIALGVALGSAPQNPMSQQADAPVSASGGDQSATQQRVPASGPSRPQRTPTQHRTRGASPPGDDRPPGFGALPVPQSLGSDQLGNPWPPSSSGSQSPVSSQTHSQNDWSRGHQAPSATAPSCAPTGQPSTGRPNVQDVRQSVYDFPHGQLSNTSQEQETLVEAATHCSPAQNGRTHAGAAMHSRAGGRGAAVTVSEAAQCVAGMDVRQSMYDSSQDTSALDDAWALPHHSHPGDCQILMLHDDNLQPQAAPSDQSLSHASQYSQSEPGWADDYRHQPQSHDAHPSRPVGAVPSRPTSEGHHVQQSYWQQEAEQEPVPRLPSASAHLAHHHQEQQVHSLAVHAQHGQHAQREQQREQCEPKRSEHKHSQHDRAYAEGHCPPPEYEQSPDAGQDSSSTRGAHVQYGRRGPYSAAASARPPEVTPTHGTAAAAQAAAPVTHPGRCQAPQATTAPYEASMPVNGQSGWDVDEAGVSATATASQPHTHSHDTCQPLSRDESSSLGSTQEAALWDLVNEEPYQIGLTVHQQQHRSFYSQHSSSVQHAQHSALEYSQQSRRQASSRFPSSRPSSADSSSQVNSQYRHSSESMPASQMQSAGHQSHSQSDEQSSSQGTACRVPQKLKHAVRRMAWVRPKPKPADKLESVKWEDEKSSGYPWKNLKALTREKKGWGWSTDEEPDPGRAIMPHSAEYADQLQLWRPHHLSFLFRKSEPPRPVGLDVEWD